MTVVPVQPQTFTVAQFYANLSSRSVAALATDWYQGRIQDFGRGEGSFLTGSKARKSLSGIQGQNAIKKSGELSPKADGLLLIILQ